jgi:hypothetical protein
MAHVSAAVLVREVNSASRSREMPDFYKKHIKRNLLLVLSTAIAQNTLFPP